MTKYFNQVRIIAGTWRGLKISFPDKEALRPTPDRVRETLFNWLTPHIVGARCLDLFAGSGILGFEALSRGAASVVAVEQDLLVVTAIIENKKQLKAESMSIIRAEGLTWLQKPNQSFDIVFLDPPYHLKILPQCFSLLEEKGWLSSKAWIYFETNIKIDPKIFPKETWTLIREKKAGNVYFYLVLRQLGLAS